MVIWSDYHVQGIAGHESFHPPFAPLILHGMHYTTRQQASCVGHYQNSKLPSSESGGLNSIALQHNCNDIRAGYLDPDVAAIADV